MSGLFFEYVCLCVCAWGLHFQASVPLLVEISAVGCSSFFFLAKVHGKGDMIVFVGAKLANNANGNLAAGKVVVLRSEDSSPVVQSFQMVASRLMRRAAIEKNNLDVGALDVVFWKFEDKRDLEYFAVIVKSNLRTCKISMTARQGMPKAQKASKPNLPFGLSFDPKDCPI